MKQTRREFLVRTGALLAASSSLGDLQAQAAGDRLNLLVIHTDEHNFRTLGCYRKQLKTEHALVWGPGAVVETPNLDWLAEHGALCDRFYTSSPVCTPSRASFVSGRFPQNTGAPVNDRPMLGEVVTFAESLRRAGYATGYAGKWHLDGPAKPGWSPARKFGFQDNRCMFNRGHWKQLENTPAGPRVKARSAKGPTDSVAGADRQSFTTDFLTDRTVEFVRAHKDKPFCYMVSIPDPHGPNTVRAPYDTMYARMKFQAPASAAGAQRPSHKGPMMDMARYFGMVKCIDDCVGRILACLKETGLIERTVVVFTSDHGDMCGEHARVNKGVPYEASARVSMLVYAPGLVKPGTIVKQAWATVDFKPTILGLLGAKGDAADEGRDASALLRGAAPADWTDVAFSRNAQGQWLMAVNRRHKLVIWADRDPSLFDLDADPLEMKDLFTDPASRETVRQLALHLQDYCRRSKEPFANLPGIREDLAWCAAGNGPYASPSRPKPSATKRKGKKGKQEEDDDEP
ncbi:MAG: Choline-sulfatase [Planctomycetes bacterium ADurb.Bin126]|nr:MAG: Choline-sulfatase [Planctomycetes bacterium ADurb.Bin126]HOD81242.1 sulfatase [Phycisphaerae bacterium]HQL71570.1 sulfatase [Phycisphaerae bacterium]